MIGLRTYENVIEISNRVSSYIDMGNIDLLRNYLILCPEAVFSHIKLNALTMQVKFSITLPVFKSLGIS